MSLVAPNLYVGDESSAASLSRLRSAGVTHVLNCTDQPNAHECVADAPTYLKLGLLDSAADLARMPTALSVGVAFIRSAVQGGGTVLVHCHAGISRSATLAMAYLVWKEQKTSEAVFEMIRSTRRICDPNLTYWCALKDWERLVLPPAMLRPRSTSTSSHASSHASSKPSSRASPNRVSTSAAFTASSAAAAPSSAAASSAVPAVSTHSTTFVPASFASSCAPSPSSAPSPPTLVTAPPTAASSATSAIVVCAGSAAPSPRPGPLQLVPNGLVSPSGSFSGGAASSLGSLPSPSVRAVY